VVFSTNKTDHHNINEILLTVALNTIPPSMVFDMTFINFSPSVWVRFVNFIPPLKTEK
jgi:hypothetical protein